MEKKIAATGSKDEAEHIDQQVKLTFHIKVLGRLLELLGKQMYKRRDTAIAELIANCWDAGSSTVRVTTAKENDYDPDKSVIVIEDDGRGMSSDEVQKDYLIVGRNRRRAGNDVVDGRPVMGRKGIGKLAGFGISNRIGVVTWQGPQSTAFELDIERLKENDDETQKVAIEGVSGSPPPDAQSASGTRITLRVLKHKTAIAIDRLKIALARRFSRAVRGRMKIFVNGEEIQDTSLGLEVDERVPAEGSESVRLPDGNTVSYYYVFSMKVISIAELRGFSVFVRGKTAQAPPFFFDVEATASGQHATRYLTGIIEADFLDKGQDDDSDIISTDRQEIDWEHDSVQVFKKWGADLTRKAMRDWVKRRGSAMEDWILQDEKIAKRIDRLEPASRNQVSRFLKILGQAESDQERAQELADALVCAYEYRNFHDVIQNIEDVSEDPEELKKLLTHLKEWKVLESRAILEIIKGRLDIIEKFHAMAVNNAPEIAGSMGDDNMHDLVAGHPWLLNPEWQVLAEEKSISRQLREWNVEDIGSEKDSRQRYDFLGLTAEQKTVIIEIKRSAHPVELEELQRLDTYREKLSKAQGEVYMVLISGGTFNVTDLGRQSYDDRRDCDLREWSEIYSSTKTYYKHYKAVLEGNIEHADFSAKEREVARTREVLQGGTVYRGKKGRAEGLGPQDVEYDSREE